MSWRTVVISSNAKLDYQMGYLVVRRGTSIKIPIKEISFLMIESTAVSLTNALLNELVKEKVKVVFCDQKRNPSSELLPYYGSYDSSIKIRKQISWSEETKAMVWTEIVTEKIRQQAYVLHCFHSSEELVLNSYIKDIQFRDATNREGHAAKVYFNSLFGKNFSRTAECSINAALNYGYTILLSLVNREISSCGYLTQLGIFHKNMFNPFNLGSDLMEPFRPVIDKKVKEMELMKFEHEEKMEVLSVINQEVMISHRREVLSNAVKIYVTSVFDALNDHDISKIKFYSCDEL